MKDVGSEEILLCDDVFFFNFLEFSDVIIIEVVSLSCEQSFSLNTTQLSGL